MAFRLDDGEEIDVASITNPATAGALLGGGLNATFCNTTITPTCLRELYNIGKFQGSLKNGNLLGICGYLEEYAKYDDLEQFVTTYTPEEDPAIANFTYVLINGGLGTQNDTVDDDVEANRKLIGGGADFSFAHDIPFLHPTFPALIAPLLAVRMLLFVLACDTFCCLYDNCCQYTPSCGLDVRAHHYHSPSESDAHT